MNRATCTLAMLCIALSIVAGSLTPSVADDQLQPPATFMGPAGGPPAMGPLGGPPGISPPAPITQLSSSEQAIKRQLAALTEIEFAEMPLTDVAAFLADRHRIPIQFDLSALRDIAIDPATLPITRNLKSIHLRSALNQILKEHNLTWIIADEVLLITTRDAANNRLETRVYDVRDLAAGKSEADTLVGAIEQGVGPADIWSSKGGRGTISSFTQRGVSALVIAQTFEAHQRIENLLLDLRRLQQQPSDR